MNRSHANCDHPATKANRAECRDARRRYDDDREADARRMIDRAAASFDPSWGRRAIIRCAARFGQGQVRLPHSDIQIDRLPHDPARRYSPTDDDVRIAALFLTDQGWDWSNITHAMS